MYNKGMEILKIGQFIAERRRGKGLTPKQLADWLFISGKTVRKWEYGKGLPDGEEKFLRVCKVKNEQY